MKAERIAQAIFYIICGGPLVTLFVGVGLSLYDQLLGNKVIIRALILCLPSLIMLGLLVLVYKIRKWNK